MQKVRIFIVDDEVMAVNYLSDMLARASDQYEVVGTATNGWETLRKLESVTADIVFMDISMPTMNGIRLSEILMRQHPLLRIILLTSYRDFDYIKRGMELGVCAYMLKNELSEEKLRHEIGRVAYQMQVMSRSDRLRLANELGEFLRNGPPPPSGFLEGGPFTLVYLFLRPRIVYPRKPLHACQDPDMVERLMSGSGRVTACVRLQDDEWAAVIEPGEGASARARAFAGELLEDWAEAGPDARAILTRAAVTDWPAAMARMRALRGRAYTWAGASAFWEDELDAPWGDQDEEVFARLRDFNTALENGDAILARQTLAQTLDLAASRLSLLGYVMTLRDIAADVKKWMNLNRVDPNLRPPAIDFDAPEQASAAFLGWLDTLTDEFSKSAGKKISVQTARAIEFVRLNYSQNISFTDACEYAQVSGSSLRRLFKTETGLSFVDYLTDYRITAAKRMMSAGEWRTGIIGEQTGFSSAPYFCSVFKKRTGMTPKEYMQYALGSD